MIKGETMKEMVAIMGSNTSGEEASIVKSRCMANAEV